MQDFRMETFLMVCETLNYTKAAQALHITQPAVSQHMAVLEKHYGVKLFVFEGKTMRLSAAGELLRNAAITIKHDEILLHDQMKTSGRPQFIFGATRTIGDFVMPDKLAQYLAHNPQADVRMLVDNTETLLQKINAGTLDFAMIEGYFQKSEFDSAVYSREQYIAVSAGSRIWNSVRLADLFAERIILREPGSGTREVLRRHLEERNGSVLDFQEMVEIGSIRAIKSMVAAGCGITFLYEASAKQEINSGVLQPIPLQDFFVENDFTWVWRKNSQYADRYQRVFEALVGR